MMDNEDTLRLDIKTMDSEQYSCGHCQIYLNSLEDLKDHLSTAHKKQTKSAGVKRKYKTKDKPKNSLKCNQCNKVLKNPHYLPIHIASVHEKKKDFECDKCGIYFARKCQVNAHKKFVHDGVKRELKPRNYVECLMCNKKVLEHCLAKHKEIVHSEKKDFACDFCDKNFVLKLYLDRHKASMHQEEDLTKNLQCSKCDKKFKQKSNLKSHEKIHNKPKELAECSICLKKFNSLKRLALHEVKHDGIFDCEQCGKICSSEYTLKRHKNAHLRKLKRKSVQCDICSKIYIDKYHYRSHYKQMHERANDVKCNICMKTYSNAKYLLEHVDRMHTNFESKFKCDACEKFFKTELEVKSHMKRVHMKINKFKCKICEKSYFTMGELKHHSKINHNDQSQRELFECNYCKKNFVTKMNRDLHIKRMHEKLKNFKCDSCENIFFSKAEVRSHYETMHFGIKKKEACQYCNKEISARFLQTHIDAVHPIYLIWKSCVCLFVCLFVRKNWANGF